MATNPAALPDPRAAYDTLFTGVRQRVFFDALAGYNPDYQPRTAKEAAELLELAADLRLAVGPEKRAGDNRFAGVRQALASSAGGAPVAAHQQALAIKAAAAALAEDPTYYNAVLSLQAQRAAAFAAAG